MLTALLEPLASEDKLVWVIDNTLGRVVVVVDKFLDELSVELRVILPEAREKLEVLSPEVVAAAIKRCHLR